MTGRIVTASAVRAGAVAALLMTVIPASVALAQDASASASPAAQDASEPASPSAPTAWPGTALADARAITATPDGFVAVGADGAFAGHAQAWTSVDGKTWVPAELTDAPEGSVMTAVTATGSGLVAVGTMSSGGATGPDRFAAWRSTDGRSWGPAQVRRPGAQGLGAGADSVADGPAGSLALASFYGQEQGPQRLYRSTDGQSWRPIPLPREQDVIWAAVRPIPGGYLLIGNRFDGRPRTYRSSDGTRWKRVREAPWLLDAAAAPDGMVVGLSTDAVVASLDLETWEDVAEAPEAEPSPDTPSLDWVTWEGTQFAFSSISYAGCPEDVDECYQRWLLTSPDGVTWTESTGPDGAVGPDDSMTILGMATLGDTTVLLGSAGASPSTAWVMPG